LNTLIHYTDTNEDITLSLWNVNYYFFEKLDSDLKNKILLKLGDSKFEKVISMLSMFIIGNYKIINSDTLDILLKNERIINFLKRNSSLVDDTLKKKLN
jgi:hypothetical protein